MKTVTMLVCPVCGDRRINHPFFGNCVGEPSTRHDTAVTEPVQFVSLPDLLELIEGEAAVERKAYDTAKAAGHDRPTNPAGASLKALAATIRKEAGA